MADPRDNSEMTGVVMGIWSSYAAQFLEFQDVRRKVVSAQIEKTNKAHFNTMDQQRATVNKTALLRRMLVVAILGTPDRWQQLSQSVCQDCCLVSSVPNCLTAKLIENWRS